MRRFIVTLVCWLVLAAPVWAGPLEDAFAAYEDADYATALRLWRPLAKQDSAYAQFGLGVLYLNGQGVPQNLTKAAHWVRKAAEQGHADAQEMLGAMSYDGWGVAQSFAEAVRWYRMAAEQGHTNAQFNLGIIFQKAGRGVPQDYVQAHKWYTLAAAGGNATAETNRQLVAKRMTPAQIADAQRIAREWLAKHGKAE